MNPWDPIPSKPIKGSKKDIDEMPIWDPTMVYVQDLVRTVSADKVMNKGPYALGEEGGYLR